MEAYSRVILPLENYLSKKLLCDIFLAIELKTRVKIVCIKLCRKSLIEVLSLYSKISILLLFIEDHSSSPKTIICLIHLCKTALSVNL